MIKVTTDLLRGNKPKPTAKRGTKGVAGVDRAVLKRRPARRMNKRRVRR